MEQEKKPYRPTPEELGQMLQEARKKRLQREATDPEYKEQWEHMERALFGPGMPKKP